MQLTIKILVPLMEGNKMSEAFILKACKSFQWHNDTIIEKNGGYTE